ncbi:hypothetical protein [Spiroplasma sp. Moj]|uniref:hypothetical protein n=1 Tax=Spiroplasma sp. Moj TaxID=1922342 RepID=UPI0039F01BC1|nr:hypothetical protein [Spiroplasma sp. Moj]
MQEVYFIIQDDYNIKNIYRINEKSKLVNIKGMTDIRNSFLGMSFNKNNDVYIATQNGMFLLINNSDTATQINNIDKKIIIDLLITDNNDLFYSNENGVYVLKQGSTTPTKIDGISNFLD